MYALTCFSGHEVTEITLSLNGAATYPRASAALSSMLGKNSLNPGDITVVRLQNNMSITFVTVQ